MHTSCPSTHAAALRKKGVMWNPGPTCIQVTSNSCHPSYLELYLSHMASIDMRRDRAFLAFRQSGLKKGFRTTYLEKITRIAGSTVVGLQSRADTATLSIVAAQKARSRLVPSRAADPLTEMHMLEIGYFDDHTTPESMMQIRTFSSFVARSKCMNHQPAPACKYGWTPSPVGFHGHEWTICKLGASRPFRVQLSRTVQYLTHRRTYNAGGERA
jgi:hypothetical protein